MHGEIAEDLIKKISNVQLVLSDCDGVLTDGSVFYDKDGELCKKYFIRDGMGVVRLRDIIGMETGIVTGEISPSVIRRAEKLKISELHLGIKDKVGCFEKILSSKNLEWSNLAYIGDDMNDYDVLKRVGFSAAPNDGFEQIIDIVDYICEKKGGAGAFREIAELIIKYSKKSQN